MVDIGEALTAAITAAEPSLSSIGQLAVSLGSLLNPVVIILSFIIFNIVFFGSLIIIFTLLYRAWLMVLAVIEVYNGLVLEDTFELEPILLVLPKIGKHIQKKALKAFTGVGAIAAKAATATIKRIEADTARIEAQAAADRAFNKRQT